jgi:hypothetical protein
MSAASGAALGKKLNNEINIVFPPPGEAELDESQI